MATGLIRANFPGICCRHCLGAAKGYRRLQAISLDAPSDWRSLHDPWGSDLLRLGDGEGIMFGLKRKVKMWGQSFVAGATNTGNVTATVGDRLVLNWHGTPTQRDDALRIFPTIRDRMMPGEELGTFADAMIAAIHDNGMSPDDTSSNIQSIAMLWRVFTTRFDGDDGDGAVTYGDMIGFANLHAVFELHELVNEQFKITWKVSVMRGR
ncbi:hypothetical protein JQ543_05480 [Bradyrhizobium diazoefficiens]|nr:hypothetical protein [Bradyrhizobium diazoefficiens]MBR0847193.1 hypothetical protein [Bradyrhizobium diazoefficiens]